MADPGYFGPDSVSWQVHRELTVLLGGARALLLQAAHPLVIAAARDTGFYERNPWKRLERTLLLAYTITFGSKAEADTAAARINQVHARISGTDPVTGLPYDALDPDLLLYVHATLVESALLYEARTVGRLDAEGRQRFHEEQMLAAEMLEIPRSSIPPKLEGLLELLRGTLRDGTLHVTDAAMSVASLLRDPPPDAMWRPVLHLASHLAFGTLPPRLAREYGVPPSPWQRASVDAGFASIRAARPLLWGRFRYVEFYLQATGRPVARLDRSALG